MNKFTIFNFENLNTNSFPFHRMAYWDPNQDSINFFVKGDLYYGIITYCEGETIYSGEIDNKKFTPEGQGVLVKKNGDYYFGQFSDGKKSGKGKEQNTDQFYEGEFKNDIKNGYGKLYHRVTKKEDQLIYEGEFENGEYNGSGIFISNEMRFDGFFKNGKKIGTFIVKYNTDTKRSVHNDTTYKMVFDGVSDIGKGEELKFLSSEDKVARIRRLSEYHSKTGEFKEKTACCKCQII